MRATGATILLLLLLICLPVTDDSMEKVVHALVSIFCCCAMAVARPKVAFTEDNLEEHSFISEDTSVGSIIIIIMAVIDFMFRKKYVFVARRDEIERAKRVPMRLNFYRLFFCGRRRVLSFFI